MALGQQVIPSLVKSLNKSPHFMDIKLYFVNRFLPLLSIETAEQMVSTFENMVKNAKEPNGVLICNINPVKIACLIL